MTRFGRQNRNHFFFFLCKTRQSSALHHNQNNMKKKSTELRRKRLKLAEMQKKWNENADSVSVVMRCVRPVNAHVAHYVNHHHVNDMVIHYIDETLNWVRSSSCGECRKPNFHCANVWRKLFLFIFFFFFFHFGLFGLAFDFAETSATKNPNWWRSHVARPFRIL